MLFVRNQSILTLTLSVTVPLFFSLPIRHIR